jgi:hypothetical protein
MARRFRRPIKKSPKCDPQRNLLYRMESEQIGGRTYLVLTKRKIISLLKNLARTYHVEPCVVRFTDMTGCAAHWEAPNVITFGAKATSRDLLTALHEFAHHLHYLIEPSNDQAAHGPEFMCCYLSVLDSTRFIPIVAMTALCDKYKIKYIAPKDTDGMDQLTKLIKGK